MTRAKQRLMQTPPRVQAAHTGIIIASGRLIAQPLHRMILQLPTFGQIDSVRAARERVARGA